MDARTKQLLRGILIARYLLVQLARVMLVPCLCNWSDTHNPNGVWTYRRGTTVLPLQTDYYAAGQYAWAEAQYAQTGHVLVRMQVVVTKTVSVGDTVMSEAVTAPGITYPWFVGVNLTIDATSTQSTPEPNHHAASWSWADGAGRSQEKAELVN